MIKLLSKNVADKIAAGEVVDRPLSIVKELVENAIDAGANSITVEIRNGGKTYIRITDNGCGISEEEAELAFLRHATSKITTDEDLNHIMTLGFRGEALASIAAVCRVELITKQKDAKVGVSLKIHGGELFEKSATGCPDGTTIIVSDLFYNTPARLKFMKTDATESTIIIDFISKIALAYADIKIRLINNGTILFSTNGKGNRYNSIVTVYSKAVGDGLVYVSGESENMSLEGYISRPDYSKTNRKQQIFFVNGRSITNKVMETAVHEGYNERLFEGRYPVAYLFFKIKPELVDVNIHPNKKEIRFHRDTDVREFITQIIKRGLLSNEVIPQIKTNSVSRPEVRQNPQAFSTQENTLRQAKVNERVTTVLEDNKKEIKRQEVKEEQVDIKNVLSNLVREQEEITYNAASAEVEVPKDVTMEIKPVESFFSKLKITGTIFNTYITALAEDCFYMIDQHAAHERIFYEQLLGQYKNEEKLHQTILTPIIVDTTYSLKSAESSWIHILRNMGFDIEPFGVKSYIVKEIPLFMNLTEAQNMVNYFIENVGEDVDIENREKVDRIITKACKSAIKANDIISPAECERLVEDLAKCENPYSCPHGRPTFIKMTKYEIEKMFKRV